MRRFILIIVATVFLIHGNAISQEKSKLKKEPKPYKPLKLNMSEDGSYYLRVLLWAQIWTTLVDNNPGTIGYDLKPDNSSTNIGIRRARMLFWAQMGPRWMILTHFGINNQTFTNGGYLGTDGKKPQLYIHDVWTEYTLIPKKLYVGAGLHYWNGVSRMSNASTLNFMTLDAPIFNWYTIETNDQFGRQLGFYVKGQLNRLDYRFAFNQPFRNGSDPYIRNERTTTGFNSELAAKNAWTTNWSQAGYLKLMLKDISAGKLPYEIGFCMDGQELLDIGAGFYNHPNSTYTLDPGTGSDSVKFYNQTIFGLDVFYNHALGNKGYLFNTYVVFQNMNYGKNYLRNIGIFNTSNVIGNEEQLGDEYANRSVMGAGNRQPTLGTGNILYAQAGLRFPMFKNGSALMPYLTGTYKNFEAINEPSFQYDLGLNYFINKHYAKVTLQYSARPIYKYDSSQENGIAQNGLKGQVTLQMQIWL